MENKTLVEMAAQAGILVRDWQIESAEIYPPRQQKVIVGSDDPCEW
jgi:hypothetical protein